MYRAFVEPTAENRVLLPEEELHHLVRVRRAREGHRFIGLDGKGRSFICRLIRAPGWEAEIVQQLDEKTESPLHVTLAQALVKKEKFEWIIQKAVELGVGRIVPLITHRTEVQLDERRETRKMERWEKIMREAVKQCGRTRVPQLALPVELEAFLRSDALPAPLVLDEEGGIAVPEWIQRHRETRFCTVLVGPEGGWDRTDRKILATRGVAAVQLGGRILRTETAPLVILTILQLQLGDLGVATA